jgi:hypothetical protein
MKIQLNIKGKSQFDPDIHTFYQPSACGSVTAFVILRHLFPSTCPFDVNELYRLLGVTKIGLFKRRFIRNIRKILGANWSVSECDIDEVKIQILEGRPVAAKFDKWFKMKWRGQFDFDYHWVPVIGFEELDGDTLLIIHDNGGRNRQSQIRHISYGRNQSVLSFVKIEPSST